MTDDGVRSNSEGLPEPGHCILDGEERWLGKECLIQLRALLILRLITLSTEHLLEIDPLVLAVLSPTLIDGINDVPNIRMQVWLQNCRASIDLLSEHRPPLIKTVRHADVVVPDAWQQENHRTSSVNSSIGKNSLVVLLLKRGNRIL